MRDLPAGTVTFLFTDIEGSTKLLHELGAERYAASLAAHRRVLRRAFAECGGAEVDTQADAFFVAFADARDALAAARKRSRRWRGSRSGWDGSPHRRAAPDGRGRRRSGRAQGRADLLGRSRRPDPRLGGDDARGRGRQSPPAWPAPTEGSDRP